MSDENKNSVDLGEGYIRKGGVNEEPISERPETSPVGYYPIADDDE